MATVKKSNLPPKTSIQGIVIRVKRIIHEPSDIILFLQIGWFIWRLPKNIATVNLGQHLDRLQENQRPQTSSIEDSLDRILRLAEPWLRRERLRSWNTCYTRAFVLYRFLTSDKNELRFHLGIDSTTGADERLHGHAWVTVDDVPVGLDNSTVPEKCRIIYSHPGDPLSKNLFPSIFD